MFMRRTMDTPSEDWGRFERAIRKYLAKAFDREENGIEVRVDPDSGEISCTIDGEETDPSLAGWSAFAVARQLFVKRIREEEDKTGRGQ